MVSKNILLCALTISALSLHAAAQVDVSVIEQYRTEHGPKILREFADFLRLPNVRTDRTNIKKNVEYLRAAFEQRGLTVEVLEVDNVPPLIVGELRTENAVGTLGFYMHYDGQPADVTQWSSAPWSPMLYTASPDDDGEPRPFPSDGEPIDPEWRLIARSASDDKGPIAALWSALDALEAAGVALRWNVKVMIEGEEEGGSPNLKNYMQQFKNKLEADLWLICDGPSHASRRAQLVFGVRGYSRIDVTVYGAARYLHSGHYGNWAPNPAMILAQLLSSMKDEQGNVLVEGFYDDVVPLTPDEQRIVDSFAQYDDALRHELGLKATEHNNASLMQRLMLPSLNVRGMQSASVGDTARNIIPDLAEASLDVRLVQGNDPKTMLDRVEAHIRAQGFHIVRSDPTMDTRLQHEKIAKVIRNEGYRATRTSMDEPAIAPVINAVRHVTGTDPLLTPTAGGSIPLYLFEEILQRPLVVVPTVNHDNNQHAPNENLRIQNLWYAIDLFATILTTDTNQ